MCGFSPEVDQTLRTDLDERSSLIRRLRAVHALYEVVCATMTLDQVNAVVVPGDLPIAFSHVHQVLIEDGTVLFVGGPPPQFDVDWSRRIGLGVEDSGKGKKVEEMTHQRIDDYDAFRAFPSLVFEATERFAARVDLTTLNDVVVAPPYGPTIVNTFSALVRGDTGITRSDALECWIY